MVRVTAACLFGQSVLGNQERFWSREQIQKVPVNSKFKSDLSHCHWLLSSDRLFYFTGLDIQTLQLSFSSQQTISNANEFRISKSPVVTFNGTVQMDDQLFLDSERIFVEFLYFTKLHPTPLEPFLTRTFNTVLVLLRQSKFALAFGCMRQAKRVLEV